MYSFEGAPIWTSGGERAEAVGLVVARPTSLGTVFLLSRDCSMTSLALCASTLRL